MNPTAKVGALQVVNGKTYEAHQVSASLKIYGLNLSCESCAAKADKRLVRLSQHRHMVLRYP